MSTTSHDMSFIDRFHAIWGQARRVQLLQAVCWTALAVVAGVALVAAIDYVWELPRAARVGAVIAVAAAALMSGLAMGTRSLRRWRRYTTAATIEHFFPQLGQRIRTTIQYGDLSAGEVQRRGVAHTLVAALEGETVQLAAPLPLDAIVPWKALSLASLCVAAAGLALAAFSAVDWQWRVAALRTFLSEQPYTDVQIEPGNAIVQDGDSLYLRVKVRGRSGTHVSIFTRRADDEGSSWKEERLPLPARPQSFEDQVAVELPLSRLHHPLDYYAAAGTVRSEVHRITVLYPLRITKQQATVQPPEYTSLPAVISEGADVTALIGSHVKLAFELDRAPTKAWLELEPLRKPAAGDDVVSERKELAVAENRLTAELDLTHDFAYSLKAEAADGMTLPENRFRVRIRPDEPPRVWFESPDDAIEVHTLAEVLMRMRATDDFGLAQAGVMFELNNEQAYPLLAEDFQAAAEELRAKGEFSPRTRATLEKVLPLEHFQLSQQDSVMYYAFAEDSKPGKAQRNETDLRFIDIRPFKRNYRPVDAQGRQGQGSGLRSLEELITRQRYALNRAIQLQRLQQGDKVDLPAVESLVTFEGELAQATRELVEGLLARGIDETELLLQAETSMLAAADSLAGGNLDTAALQMRDALKQLIEGRNRIDRNVFRNANRQQLARLRAFDRVQRQKLRRPKSDAELARQLIERLQALEVEETALLQAIEAAAGKTQEEQSMQELADRQSEVAAEARDIEADIAKLAQATDLVKERATQASEAAEKAAQQLTEGATESKQAISSARDQFAELAKQLQALFAAEQAQRVQAAQLMAQELAREQLRLASQLAPPPGMGGKGETPPDMPARGMARKLAERAKTLNDVMGAAQRADAPEDQKSADEVKQIAAGSGLKEAAERMAMLADQLAAGKREEARANAKDAAERLEAAAQRLAVLHRSLVEPQAAELAKLEQAASKLKSDLEQLETDERVNQWHLQANELIEKLEDKNLAADLREELEKEMERGGWNSNPAMRNARWQRNGSGAYGAPGGYHTVLNRLTEALRGRLHELLLGNMQATGDEPIPPQYQEHVDRYYQILALEKSLPTAPTPQPRNAPKR